jgi:hypothetical protein
MRIGAQSAFIDNTLQRKGGVAYDSEKAAKQIEVDAQRVQQEQIDKKKLTIPQDIEFKLRQRQLLQEQQTQRQTNDKKLYDPKKQSAQSGNQYEASFSSLPRTSTAIATTSNSSSILTEDELPRSNKAISAYETTATLEKRQEIAELVGFDGFA